MQVLGNISTIHCHCTATNLITGRQQSVILSSSEECVAQTKYDNFLRDNNKCQALKYFKLVPRRVGYNKIYVFKLLIRRCILII